MFTQKVSVPQPVDAVSSDLEDAAGLLTRLAGTGQVDLSDRPVVRLALRAGLHAGDGLRGFGVDLDPARLDRLDGLRLLGGSASS
jgi:hypothetical protein